MRSIRPALLFAGASTFALAWTANAQTKPDDSGLEEVVVTGSRVIINGNDSPTPITVVTTEDLTTVHPGNIAEALNDMPVFSGSRGMNSNTGTSGAAGSPATSTNAGNVVNLRQMGLLRTLVLYDGHRAAPSTPDGFVDLDTIPQLLLKRVDVVTGGVSAVYGSDAISGVVNFVTDTKFEGIKGNLQAGRSTYNDADTVEGGIAFGTSLFDGRGHVMGSFESRDASPIDSKFDRPWGRNVYTLQGQGTASSPYYQATGARQFNATFGGRVNGATNLTANPLYDKQFTSGGYLVPFAHGTQTGTAGGQYELGGDGGYYNGQLRAELDMNQLYGRFDFDFTDDLHSYFTVTDTLNHSVAKGINYNSTSLVINRDNAFLLPAYQAQMAAANQTSLSFGKIFTDIPRGEVETYAKQYMINTGLDGSFGGGYRWEVSYTHARSKFEVRQNVAIDQGRLFAALDSVVSNGVPVCRASLTNAAYAGCVPLNPFGVNSESQAAIDYVVGEVGWQTELGMDDVSATLTGAPFSTWAGPINSALSTEWRRLSYEIDSNNLPSARANCAGITGNCNANTQTYTVPTGSSSVANVPEVSTTIGEAAIEFGVPLLKDAPFAKALDLNTAYRFAHYDRAGNARTWKVGLTWDPVDWLTVRATRSRDFRAPSLDENFRALAVSFNSGFADTLAGSQVPQPQNVRTENGGNPDLKSEVGDTLTYGVVVRPTDNFDFAVDAFHIKVRDAIFLIQGNTPDYQNVCYASGGSSPYCQLIGRGLGSYTDTSAANAVTLWKQTFINLAEIETWGADIEANYRTRIGTQPLSLRLLTTYQPHLIYRQPGVPDYEYAGVSFGTNGLQANPRWRATGFITYQPTDSFTVNVMERWRSSLPRYHANPQTVQLGSGVKSVAYTNLTLTYSPALESGKVDVFVNVQNLLNKDPPQAGFWGNPNPGQFGEFAFGDDVIGRYYTAGARFRF
jgi:outer membrane receptor protein involved in Fe transport